MGGRVGGRERRKGGDMEIGIKEEVEGKRGEDRLVKGEERRN